jgi:hypothetical protein
MPPLSELLAHALQLARQEAARVQSPEVGTAHLLVGLLKAGGLANELLTAHGIDLRAVRNALEGRTDPPLDRSRVLVLPAVIAVPKGVFWGNPADGCDPPLIVDRPQ